ncbi:MAG: sialate O-acetylesterase [Sphingobacteriia bacterium]|nr:sialate O-acetylesterase [Sphingobacteriia bacterium]
MHLLKKYGLCLLLFGTTIQTIRAQLKLAEVFGDNMVLQRGKPICFWGKAIPGDIVSIRFAGKNRKVVAGQNASWRISFPKKKATTRPLSVLVASSGQTIQIHNVLIGDVWVCSGQSNMEFPMHREMHFTEEKQQAYLPLVRLCNPPPAGRFIYGTAFTDSLNRRLTKDSFYLWNGWHVCDSNSFASMSAVAYYFAKQITAREKIPVGMINLSISGAPIETFIRKEALLQSGNFANKAQSNWLTNPDLPKWIKERGFQNVGGNKNGFGDESGLNHAYKPGFAFECGIKPLLPFAITGILWYQGESNSLELNRAQEYKDLLKLLISDYRLQWKEPQLPFFWVQLSSIDTLTYKSQYWPLFRNEQRKLMNEIPFGGMAVSSDVGSKTDVHPANKKVVGERLARWALHNVYKEAIIASGPLPLKAVLVQDTVVVYFTYSHQLQTSDHQPVQGFSLDGITTVAATIKNNTVQIPVKQKPLHLYYAWQPFSKGNLVNEEMLPASTFLIDILDR